MTPICNSPFGFEDGHITGYHSEDGRLEVIYEFWNEETGVFRFDGLIAVHDNGAIGVTVASVTEVDKSELVALLIRRHFDVPPETTSWHHFKFLDLDDGVMFEVVAESCSFIDSASPSAS